MILNLRSNYEYHYIGAISYDDRTESDDAQMQEPRDRENVPIS